ncbi:MAG: hypothetical protein KGL67_02095 [Patescibacteria group bacterium]|nr:hypothetical protein [Patescibacteria group bacterium]
MQKFTKWLKKYFVPHGENNYKPHFLRRESTILILFVIIVIELGFLIQVFVVFDKTSFLASVLPGVLTTLTNEERAQNNLAPLTENSLLTQAAQLKANDMATRGYFAHTSPDGKTPWYWLDQVGYDYSMAGENLAVNFFESQDVAQAWMNSPTHRANIVKPNYTEIGIGVANGIYEGKNTVFVAQFFGTPVAVPSAPTTTPTETKTTIITPVAKPKITAVGGTPPKAVANTPTAIPKAITATPTAVRVLGEETNSSIATTGNDLTISNIKSFIQKILTSPREYVAYIYSGIALIMIFALILVIFIKKEFQHPAMIGRGLAVLAIIIFLLLLNTKIFEPGTQVPTDGLSASVIAY